MKDAENIRNRIDLLNQLQPYVGTYFSKEYVRKKILRFSDEEIEEIENQNQEDPVQDSQQNMPFEQPINNNQQQNQ